MRTCGDSPGGLCPTTLRSGRRSTHLPVFNIQHTAVSVGTSYLGALGRAALLTYNGAWLPITDNWTPRWSTPAAAASSCVTLMKRSLHGGTIG